MRYQLILSTLTSLQNFARYSGLRVNDEKTEIFAIDPHSLVQDAFTHKMRTTQLDWRPTATLSLNQSRELKIVGKIGPLL